MSDDLLIAEVRRTMDAGAVRRPLPRHAIEQAERSLMLELPPLVKRLYAEVGDGGFGPGHGFLPLLEAEDGNHDESAVGLYRAFRESDPVDVAWVWPPGLLPICDWGCGIRSCVDCTQPRGPMRVFDPGAAVDGEPLERALLSTHDSVHEFLRAWVSDVDIWAQMFEPDELRTVRFRNPFTGEGISKPRQRLKK